MNEFLKAIFEHKINSLPRFGDVSNRKSGCYFLYDEDELVYIGQSQDIDSRIGVHLKEAKKKFTSYSFLIVNDESDRRILERGLINTYLPFYNNDPLTQKIRSEINQFEQIFQKY